VGSGGGARAVLEEGLKEGAPGLLNGTDSPVMSLRSKPRGHDGLNRANGVKLRRRRSYPRWRPGSNLAASGAVVDDGGLGKTPDVEADQVRGLQDSGLGGSAWPRRRRGPAPAAGCGMELVLWWRLRDED